MKRLLGILHFVPLMAIANTGDDAFLSAREAYRNGERVRLAKNLDALRGNELQPWVEYWQLRLKIEDKQTEAVPDFLTRHSGTYLAEKLRGDWLRLLGKQHEWDVFQQEYPRLTQPDQEVTCYALQARLARQDGTALDEARPLWFSLIDMPESCMPLMEQLVAERRLDADDVWERLRRLLEAKKLQPARFFARYLPQGQEPDAKTLDTIVDKPARYLARLPANFAATKLGREMALFALARMARSDPAAAAAQWQPLEDRFSAAERTYAWGQIAWQAALRHQPEALSWYECAAAASPATALSEEQLAWKARAALRIHDWASVRKTIEQMPTQLAGDPAWVYWLARALAAHDKPQEARALYLKISGQPNFYGNLADEELGRSFSLPLKALPPTIEEVAQAAANPGLRRALALMRLDLRIEGVREWNWTVRGMDDRQLLAAADFARRQDVFDRAISTADRTLAQHDYGLRYLAPFREYVDPKSRDLALDRGWVYGLMRQESRFVMNANSSVGAKGLMQLMPATAKWVAKKINLQNFKPARVVEMDTNVTLGTHYLKMVLDSLDNHPVLASAAYNAGPGRARRWRADRPLEGAIYAETIPFSETRDYVKKVMCNAIYYSALFEDKPQSLKSRLGIVRAKGGDPVAEDLP
ncbi:MAG: transglycosylase SLT domain-containing protein [Rhodocyclaceae bacterium]|nr:transglycosylase SLT domain-containing protein [Rhodocyclaceae bacterium]